LICTCLICNRQFNTIIGLSKHVWRTHKLSSRVYYDKYLKKELDGCCIICGNSTKFVHIIKGYKQVCSRKCYRENVKSKIKEKQCLTCNNIFIGKRSDQQFCSHLCVINYKLFGWKQIWSDPIRRDKLLEKRKIGNATPEAIQNRSIARLNMWKSPEYRAKRDKSHWSHTEKRDEVCKNMSGIKKEEAKTNQVNSKEHMLMMTKASSHNKKINKSEQKLLDILNNLFPSNYKFVGGFEVMIGGFFPDFININGQKKIVELYGDYWHNISGSEEKDNNRLQKYSEYGYKTLVVWEKELKDKILLKQKLIEFHKEGVEHVSNLS